MLGPMYSPIRNAKFSGCERSEVRKAVRSSL